MGYNIRREIGTGGPYGLPDEPAIRRFGMKNAIFALFAVLLAMAISCTGSLGPVKEPAQYTPDGRLLVNLTIGASRTARAMTLDLAKAGADYYEVTFFDGTDYYRTAWDFTKNGRIRVPVGTYATASEKK